MPHQPPSARPADTLQTDPLLPFVHLVRSGEFHYAYDVNTRRIIRVSPAMWDLLKGYGRLGRQELLAAHLARHGRQQAEASLEQIDLARSRDGLFLSVRPEDVSPPTPERVASALESQRGQLILNVTNECNFRCRYCVYGGSYPEHRGHSSVVMARSTAQAAIDEFLAHSQDAKGPVISFYGGEPLLGFDLIRRCVEHVRQHDSVRRVRFALTVNGSLLSGERAEFLGGEDFLVSVSLDGPAELHDRNRRTRSGEATWQRVTGNIEAFLERFPSYRTNGQLRFIAVVSPTTDLRRVQDFFSSCNLFTDAMGLEVDEQRPQGQAGDPGATPLRQSAAVLYADFVASLKSGQYQAQRNSRTRWVQTSLFQKAFALFHNRGYLSPHLPRRVEILNTCIPGARRNFVNVRGEYYACERVVECQRGRIGSVAGGVDSARVLALLREWQQASSDQCRFCWCLPTCTAGCFATVGTTDGVNAQAMQAQCASHRQRMHRLLTDYCSILQANPQAFDFVGDMEFS